MSVELTAAPPRQRARRRVRDVIALTRAGTCVSGGLVCVVGAGLSGSADRVTTVAAALSIACAIAFAQVTNDIIDADLDRIDKPDRPLPSGALSRDSAKALALLCAVGAIAAATVNGLPTVTFTVLLLVFSWVYSVRWKGTILLGNVVVAALASSCVTYGAMAGGEVTLLVVSVQAVVFVFSLAFEVLKTGRDVQGDAAAGIDTVATRFGVRPTALLAAGLCVVAAAVAVVPAALAPRPLAYLVAMGVCGILPALLCAHRLQANGNSATDLGDAFGTLRVAWSGGVLSFLTLL